LLLADEPTGNLDSAGARLVLDLLLGLSAERARTILLVTHDPNQAALADRRVVLRDGLVVSAAADESSVGEGTLHGALLAALSV
jgi:putative ABC transport system ATP-binding protein